jgi:hypothetical protein
VSRPTIVTSSWYTQLPTADLFSAAPESYCRIGISRGTPRGQSGFRMYRRLQPGSGTLKLPAAEFTSHDVHEVLGRLDARQVVGELLDMAGGATPALLCFEHTHGNRGATGGLSRRGSIQRSVSKCSSSGAKPTAAA